MSQQVLNRSADPEFAEDNDAARTLVAKLEQKKKRRVTIACVLVISLGVLFVIPLMYEQKAREFYDYAARLEEAARESMNFTQAKEAYEDVLKNYKFSTQAAKAEAALERISRLEGE